MVEVKNPNIEKIETLETPGIAENIKGLSSAKSFKTWLESRINLFRKRNNLEMVYSLEGVKSAYLKFHPQEVREIELEPWRGHSGFDVLKYPDHFEVIEFRKIDKDSKPKELRHKVYRKEIIQITKTLESSELNKRYKTREFAEIYCRINHLWKNAEGKDIIDNDGFNFSNLSGCRESYFDFYYCLKILEFYKIIKYEKSGHITKLKEKYEGQLTL